MSKSYAPDFGSVALWIDDRADSSTACTGRVKLLDEEGNVIKEVGIYLYENLEKVSERSCDYYGWLKELGGKQDKPAPVKSLKKQPVNEAFEERGIGEVDSDVAF